MRENIIGFIIRFATIFIISIVILLIAKIFHPFNFFGAVIGSFITSIVIAIIMDD
jgi:hypothetical protein